jgi:hypothetical protein
MLDYHVKALRLMPEGTWEIMPARRAGCQRTSPGRLAAARCGLMPVFGRRFVADFVSPTRY